MIRGDLAYRLLDFFAESFAGFLAGALFTGSSPFPLLGASDASP